MKKIFLSLILLSMSVFALTSCGGSTSGADIINPEADFLYFYGWSCPHCQELNAEMEQEDIYSKIAIEKREVYENNANRELFAQTAQELGISENDMGVPFVLNKTTKEYTVGSQPAMEAFHAFIENNGSASSKTQTGSLENTSESSTSASGSITQE